MLLEDFVLLSMDPEQRKHAELEGRCESGSAVGIEGRLHMLFGPRRPLQLDAERVEWSCLKDVITMLTVDFGNLSRLITEWKRANPQKVVPIMLRLGILCEALYTKVAEKDTGLARMP